MNEALVLVNATAGGGRAGRAWQGVARYAEGLAAIRVVAPEGRAASEAAVREAVRAGCPRVVVVGGDGTVHLVVNALLAAGGGEHVTLGVVPMGTGCDLARALRIPGDLHAALRRAILGPPTPLDAGQCRGPSGTFYFVNVASAGIGGLVDEKVNAMPQRGRTAFLCATLAALRHYRPVPLRVEVDGASWSECPVLLIAVANGTTFGRGMRIAPRARPDDGAFDVVLVGEVRGTELLLRLPQVYLGKHLGARPVRQCRARIVRIEPLAPLPAFDADGETYASGPATFEVLASALRIAGDE